MLFLEQTATALKMCDGLAQLAGSSVTFTMSSVKTVALCFVFSFCPEQLLHISLCSSVSSGLCHGHCTQCEVTLRGGLWFLGRVIPFPALSVRVWAGPPCVRSPLAKLVTSNGEEGLKSN